MGAALARFRGVYGSHPLHLLTLIAGFALLGYVLTTIKPTTLWNPNVWWQSIIVWFAAAIIAHDLVLFPVYALADRILLYVTDGDDALAAVRSTGLEPLTSLVRRGTLEDVFLRLTGRRLED